MNGLFDNNKTTCIYKTCIYNKIIELTTTIKKRALHQGTTLVSACQKFKTLYDPEEMSFY